MLTSYRPAWFTVSFRWIAWNKINYKIEEDSLLLWLLKDRLLNYLHLKCYSARGSSDPWFIEGVTQILQPSAPHIVSQVTDIISREWGNHEGKLMESHLQTPRVYFAHPPLNGTLITPTERAPQCMCHTSSLVVCHGPNIRVLQRQSVG